MFVAINQASESRQLAQTAVREDDFVCPGCSEEVILRRGSVLAPHFAHKAQSTCRHGEDGSSIREAKRVVGDEFGEFGWDVDYEVSCGAVTNDLVVKKAGASYAFIFQEDDVSFVEVLKRNVENYRAGRYKATGWVAVGTAATNLIEGAGSEVRVPGWQLSLWRTFKTPLLVLDPTGRLLAVTLKDVARGSSVKSRTLKTVKRPIVSNQQWTGNVWPFWVETRSGKKFCIAEPKFSRIETTPMD